MTTIFKYTFFFTLILLTACSPAVEQEGGGQLPEHGTELLHNLIAEERNDETGGVITYVEDAQADDLEGTVWCVNVRYINRQGIITAPFLVRQTGDDWFIDRTDQANYERYGCVWP